MIKLSNLKAKVLPVVLAAVLAVGAAAIPATPVLAEEEVKLEKLADETGEEEEPEEEEEEELEEEEEEEEEEAEEEDEVIPSTNQVQAVAKIGDNVYVTLDDAINALKKGEDKGEIVLLADATISKVRTITTDVAINGNGHPITIENRGFRTEDDRFLISNGASFSVKNTSLYVEAWDVYGAVTGGQQSMVISGAFSSEQSYVSVGNGGYIYIGSQGSLNVKQGAFMIENPIYTAIMGEGKPAINLLSGGNLVVNGGANRQRAITACNILVDGGSLNVYYTDGIRACDITVKDGGAVNANGNNTGIILYGDTLTVEKGGSLYANGNRDRAIYTRDGASTIIFKEGSTATFNSNGTETAYSQEYGPEYEAQKAAITLGLKEVKKTTTTDTMIVEDGATVYFENNVGRAITNFGTMSLGNGVVIDSNGAGVALGGGILNAGMMTIADGALIAMNTASVAGDDIYNLGENTEGYATMMENPTIVLGESFKHEELAIDGWYEDEEDARWSEDTAKLVAPGTVVGTAAIKAAHGKAVIVTPAPAPAPAAPAQVLGATRAADPAPEGDVLGAARSPKTADNSHAVLWMLLLGASAMSAAALKRKEEVK